MDKLTTREEEVMELYWKNKALFVRELMELYPDPKPHFNTLSTVVRGLEEKGYISHKTYGNSHQYYAVISKQKYHNSRLKKIISKYFDNSLLTAVSSLAKEEDISIEELKDLINKVENQ